MDSPSPPSTTALPPLPNTKLRLMCSYGGHIVPRPNKKSLFYSGGETRIVAVDRRTTISNLSLFTSHLSRTLFNNRPFNLKYQLPNEDIDSLISVTTDEDLQNMLEEHDRVVNSDAPSRIRLFLFPTKPESVGTVLLDPKSESWFNDALKSTMMIQRGQSADAGNMLMGFEGLGLSDSSADAQGESLSNGAGEVKNGLMDFGSESMVLETNSSYGSTGSSTSMSTLPPIGEERKVRVASSGSLDSDNSVASAVSHPKTGVHQDQAVHITSSDAKIFSNNLKPESISSMIQMQNVAQVFAHQLPPATEERSHQQVQYIHSGGHYMSQYPTGPVPMSSYYPMYQPQLHQQQLGPYQPNPPNPPYPVYLLPIRPTQSYNMSVSHTPSNAANIASSRPPLPPQTSLISTQVPYKEVTPAPVPELTSDIYWSAASSIQKKQTVDPSDSYQTSFPAASDTLATANHNAENDAEDLTYAQIYKSQPPAPAMAPPYEAMTKAAKVLLSETSTQLQGTSQPQ